MAVLATAGPAAAQDLGTIAATEPYVAWSEALPGAAVPYSDSTEDDCTLGRTGCVDKVIREMERRAAPLIEACDHDVIFAMAYLRTTEQYRLAVEDPDFFEDTAFENRADVVFARFYFDAFDSWHGRRVAETPRAWAIAFESADDRAVSGTGNLLLGMNAHVQRDLPFVIAGLGAVRPDGTSRKADHDRVNRILAQVYGPLIEELARRFDPTIDDSDLVTRLDNAGIFQLLPLWREIAWRNAEKLASAPTPDARALVASQIEAYAASQAQLIRSGTAYRNGQTSAERDSFCAAQRDA